MKHAPLTGYGFEAKQQQYRKRLWGWIDEQLSGRRPRSRRVVAYLDTREAVETIYLLSLGYSAENLHAVNINPAEVALLTMRLKELGLPRVATHGKDFIRSLKESKVQRWDVMSFDGCGPVASPNTLRCMKQMSDLASIGTILSANVLAGRDTGEHAGLLREDKADRRSTHDRRWEWIRRAFAVRMKNGTLLSAWGIAAEKRGIYLSSSGQPMLWLAVRLAAPPVTGGVFASLARGRFRGDQGHIVLSDAPGRIVTGVAAQLLMGKWLSKNGGRQHVKDLVANRAEREITQNRAFID